MTKNIQNWLSNLSHDINWTQLLTFDWKSKAWFHFIMICASMSTFLKTYLLFKSQINFVEIFIEQFSALRCQIIPKKIQFYTSLISYKRIKYFKNLLEGKFAERARNFYYNWTSNIEQIASILCGLLLKSQAVRLKRRSWTDQSLICIFCILRMRHIEMGLVEEVCRQPLTSTLSCNLIRSYNAHHVFE